MLITELFTSKALYNIIANDKMIFEAEFEINKKSYTFLANREEVTEDEEWEVQFYLLGGGTKGEYNYDVSASGDELAVFSTVLEILKDFIRVAKPKFLGFSSLEPSRTKLYKRMISRFANKLGWDFKIDQSYDGSERFSLVKNHS